MSREVKAWIIAFAIILALFSWLPDVGWGARLPSLGCREAKLSAAWVLRHDNGGLYRDAREKHIVCEQRINRTRWRLAYGFWAGGPWVFYGKVFVWIWPHDPSRFAYWIIPHAMRHR